MPRDDVLPAGVHEVDDAQGRARQVPVAYEKTLKGVSWGGKPVVLGRVFYLHS